MTSFIITAVAEGSEEDAEQVEALRAFLDGSGVNSLIIVAGLASGTQAASKAKPKAASKAKAEEEPDEEEVEEDEESEDGLWDEESLNELDLDDLNELAEAFGLKPTFRKPAVAIAAILEAQEQLEEEDEEEESDEGDEEEGDDEEETLDEDALAKMSTVELKKLLKDYGGKFKVGMKKDAIIEAIFEAAEAAEEE